MNFLSAVVYVALVVGFFALLAAVVVVGLAAIWGESDEPQVPPGCEHCDHGLVWNPFVDGNVSPCWHCSAAIAGDET